MDIPKKITSSWIQPELSYREFILPGGQYIAYPDGINRQWAVFWDNEKRLVKKVIWEVKSETNT